MNSSDLDKISALKKKYSENSSGGSMQAPFLKRSCTSIMIKGISSVNVQNEGGDDNEESKKAIFEMQAAH